MMLPPFLLAIICLTQARVVRNAPSRWIASIFFHSAKENSSIGWTIWMPALLTRMSMLPKALMVLATAASTWASSVTSAATPMALSLPISAAVASAAAWLISAMATFAPARTYSSAISLPMPLAAPVTKATFPVSVMECSLGLGWEVGSNR